MKKILSLLLVILLILSVAGCGITTPKQDEKQRDAVKLRVHFLDVGQGDSILLESEGEFVLVDAGEKDCGRFVLDYIRDRDADSLKYVIATHPHTDHIGGLTTVINGIKTENFITCETDQQTATWKNVLKAVDKNDVNYIDAMVGSSYRFGEAEFTILAPHSSSYEGGYNDYSVVIMAQYGDNRFLLTGDAGKVSEREMLEAGADLHADVLKCGHHGSSDSSSEGFLLQVDPAFAVVSCAQNNEYGHPHTETLQKLELMHCTCLRTDTMGTIVAAADGKHIDFTTEKGTQKQFSYTSGERQENDGTTMYIGNKNSRIFHYYICPGAASMKEKNRVALASREDAVSQGFTPCPSCQP